MIKTNTEFVSTNYTSSMIKYKKTRTFHQTLKDVKEKETYEKHMFAILLLRQNLVFKRSHLSSEARSYNKF